MSLEGRDWLNSFGKYRMYSYEVADKEQKLLDYYGWFFDDKYVYYQTKKAKIKKMILRVPAYLWPETGGSHFTEKWRRHAHDKQTRLPVKIKKIKTQEVCAGIMLQCKSSVFNSTEPK
jgi:hypothetical protein